MEKSGSSSLFQRSTAVDFIAIGVLWLIAVVIVNPIGNFPLNDDWSMGMTVKRLVEEGDYRPSGWTAMTLIAEVLWGSLFCIPHGFSFTALRFSTLTLSLVGVLGIYVLIRQLRQSRLLAVICALTLCFNPVYFALSNTFMSDVPFTVWGILSSLFFVRHLQTGRDLDLLIATVLAIVATLCRQLGLAIPLGFGAALLFQCGFQKRSLLRALLPAVLTAVAFVTLNHWLKVSGRIPASYALKTDELVWKLGQPLALPLNLAHFGWNMLMYFGCFLLPILVVVTLNRRQTGKFPRAAMLTRFALLAFLALTVGRFVFMPGLMPVHNNILDPRGIGPLTLRDTELLKLPHVPPLPTGFWVIVTALSLFGAGLLIFSVIRTTAELLSKCRKGHIAPRALEIGNAETTQPDETGNADGAIAVFFLVCTLIYLAPLLVNGFFDRYLVPAVVFLAAFLGVASKGIEYPSPKPRRFAAIVLLVCFGLYAVTGTRDYLAWNRIRWTALEDLRQKNVPPEQIDGGFEFNGWHFYDPNYHVSPGKSDWWVVDDNYLLSFGQMTGYEIFREYKYAHWLPPYQGKILVLKRKLAPPTTGREPR